MAIVIEPAVIVRPEAILEFTSNGADPTVAGYPIVNLVYDAPVAWRALAAAGNTFDIIFRPGQVDIDTIALLQTNLPEAAIVTIFAGPTSQSTINGTHDWTSGPLAFRASLGITGRPGYHGLFQFASRQAEWWRLRIVAALPGGLLHAEHLVVGRNRHSKNHSVNKTETALNLGSLERTRSGMPDRNVGLKMRRVEFDISFIDETIYETIYGDFARVIDEPIFVVPNSKSGAFLHDRMLFGDLKTSKVVQPSSFYYTRTWGVDSLI